MSLGRSIKNINVRVHNGPSALVDIRGVVLRREMTSAEEVVDPVQRPRAVHTEYASGSSTVATNAE
jgi:hypothetical protein